MRNAERAMPVMVLAVDTFRLTVLRLLEFNRLREDIRKLPTLTKEADGSDMIPVAMIRTIASIVPGNTDASPAASARAMSSG